jgi:hypothetical protein
MTGAVRVDLFSIDENLHDPTRVWINIEPVSVDAARSLPWES